MGAAYVTLDGYAVRRVTKKAVRIAKDTKDPMGLPDRSDLAWLPRSACAEGDIPDIGDTDIMVRESVAEEKGLDCE
jgi:hypothetical protein